MVRITTDVSPFLTGNVSTNTSTLDNISASETVNLDYGSIESVTKWIWIIVSPIIFIIGIVGNLGIFAVLFHKNFKQLAYKLLLILAFSDSVVLATGLSKRWIENTFDYNVRHFSDAGCRIHVFLVYFSMHFSSWTLVCISFERFVKTKFPFYYRRPRFSFILKLAYVVIVLLTIGLDLPLIPINGLVWEGNQTKCIDLKPEYYVYEENIFVFIDFVWLSLLPFLLMLIMNVFIGKVLRNSRRMRDPFISDPDGRRRSARSSKKLTRMFFVTSFYFLLTTLPISIYFIVDSFLRKDDIETVRIMELTEAVLYLFQFSNYAANFYIYIKVNKTFRGTCVSMFKSKRTYEQQSSSSLRTTRTSCDDFSNTGGNSIRNGLSNVNQVLGVQHGENIDVRFQGHETNLLEVQGHSNNDLGVQCHANYALDVQGHEGVRCHMGNGVVNSIAKDVSESMRYSDLEDRLTYIIHL